MVLQLRGPNEMAGNASDGSDRLRSCYPQFNRVLHARFDGVVGAWRGSVSPFDSVSDVAAIYSALKNDEVVNIQAGRLRHLQNRCADARDKYLAYLINMEVEFSLLALEFSGGRHSEVYCVTPEISRQRFPFHPHLRDDRSVFWGGRFIQALCTDYAPDRACNSLLDSLDYATIFLAKHLVWVRTRRLVDRALGQQYATGTRCRT